MITLLFSCKNDNEAIEFSSLVLTTIDETCDTSGRWQLKYEIENFDDYKSAFSISVSAMVSDSSGKIVPVNDDFTIDTVENEVYDVMIIVTAKTGERKTSSYVLTAKRQECTVTFIANDSVVATRTVLYGDALTDVPPLPEVKAEDYPQKMGFDCTGVTRKYWLDKDLSKITSNLTVEAIYEYGYTAKSVTLSFDTHGGSVINDMHGIANVDTFYPPSAPKKSGFFFTGWHADEELTIPYSFSTSGDMRFPLADLTLHAGWVQERNDFTDPSLFEFTLAPSKYYYVITGVTDKAALPEALKLPCCYEGLPVCAVNEGVFAACGNIISVNIPYTFKGLGNFCFADSYDGVNSEMNLKTVTFESSVGLTTIPTGCFSGCSKLEAFTLPASVSYISASSFSRCTSLETFVIPENSIMTRIEQNAFLECSSLQQITLPSEMRTLNQSAFEECSALTKITINATSMVIISGSSAPSIPQNSDLKIYVPSDLLAEYSANGDWNKYNLLAILE